MTSMAMAKMKCPHHLPPIFHRPLNTITYGSDKHLIYVRINVTTNFVPISLIALRSLGECSLIQRLIIAIFSQRKRFDRNRNDQTENRNRPIAYGLAQRRKPHDSDTIAIVRRTGIGPESRDPDRDSDRKSKRKIVESGIWIVGYTYIVSLKRFWRKPNPEKFLLKMRG